MPHYGRSINVLRYFMKRSEEEIYNMDEDRMTSMLSDVWWCVKVEAAASLGTK